jgi:hypothetical protein
VAQLPRDPDVARAVLDRAREHVDEVFASSEPRGRESLLPGK